MTLLFCCCVVVDCVLRLRYVVGLLVCWFVVVLLFRCSVLLLYCIVVLRFCCVDVLSWCLRGVGVVRCCVVVVLLSWCLCSCVVVLLWRGMFAALLS